MIFEESDSRAGFFGVLFSGHHLLIGAAVLAHYFDPRETADADYIVSDEVFDRLRKFLKRRDKGAHYVSDVNEIKVFSPLRVDVIAASRNLAVLNVLRREYVGAVFIGLRGQGGVTDHRGRVGEVSWAERFHVECPIRAVSVDPQ